MDINDKVSVFVTAHRINPSFGGMFEFIGFIREGNADDIGAALVDIVRSDVWGAEARAAKDLLRLASMNAEGFEQYQQQVSAIEMSDLVNHSIAAKDARDRRKS